MDDADSDRPQPFYLTPIAISPFHAGEMAKLPPPSKEPLNINMMPFLVGGSFEDCKLPESVRPYWSLIEVSRRDLHPGGQACLAPERDRAWHHLWPQSRIPSEMGKVNYLTIQVLLVGVEVVT